MATEPGKHVQHLPVETGCSSVHIRAPDTAISGGQTEYFHETITNVSYIC